MEQGDSTPLRPSAPERARWGLGRVLRLATGVREDVLALVPSERARYTSMGGVVAGTAIMAMLSMSAALYFMFGGFEWFIVAAVPVWGMFIISLDRWLMSSTAMGDGGRAWRKLLPRLGLSIALGVILAEPLLLGIYNTAITERVGNDRQQAIVARGSMLHNCNPVPGAPEPGDFTPDDPRCNDYHLTVPGDSPTALQGKLADLVKQRDALKTIADADAAKYAELNELARRECNGTSGAGLTGKVGEGPNCKRLRGEADQYHRDHQIDENQAKLADLNKQITDAGGSLGDARNGYASVRDKAIETDLAAFKSRQGNVGLLERFRTLDELVSDNSYVSITQWAIRIFFIIVDALPVILKALSGTTAYDRLLGERVREQERIQKMRSDEAVDRSSRWSDVVRHDQDLQRRLELERRSQQDRIERAQIDEDRGELVDALEAHLLQMSIGPAGQGRGQSSQDSNVYDTTDFSEQPTVVLDDRRLYGGQQ
ncbi:DUF4407 domain-containing protein [Dactylosporangium vinaceum]